MVTSDPTIDDQIKALAPLKVGVLAALACYSYPQVISHYRSKGRLIPDHRLEVVARNLERLAVVARDLKLNP